MKPSPRVLGFLAVAAALVTLGSRPLSHASQQSRIPERLADSTYWRLITTFSEPSGFFPSENFVSNETDWQLIIPSALRTVRTGDAYLGVGPEQNFTYITAFKPKIAFITDIRRQNLVQHLLYKSLFEMSETRVEFLSRLWSRWAPPSLDTSSTPAAILEAFAARAADSVLGAQTLSAVFARLVNRHGFVLSGEDSSTMRAVFSVFFREGPDINYASRSRGFPPGSMVWGSGGMVSMSVNGNTTTWHLRPDSTGTMRAYRDSAGVQVRDPNYAGPPGTTPGSFTMRMANGNFATFGSLMTENDGAGTNRGWLATEANYRWLRDFQQRNLLVPVVGNFGGDKALRAVGGWLKEHSARVGAFYTSNVEQYLFQDAIAGKFYDNVATFPADSASIFIRSFPGNYSAFQGPGLPRRSGARLAQTISPIEAILRMHRDGMIKSYTDLARLSTP
jgi:hypothetical protein